MNRFAACTLTAILITNIACAEDYQVGKQANANGRIINTQKLLFGLIKGIGLVTDDGTRVVCQSKGKYSNSQFKSFKKGDHYSCEGTVDEFDEVNGGFFVILEDRNLAAEAEAKRLEDEKKAELKAQREFEAFKAKRAKEIADKQEARANELVLVQGSFTAFSVNDGQSKDVDHGKVPCGISMNQMKRDFENQVGKAELTGRKVEKHYVREIWHSNNGSNKLSMICYEPVFKKRSELD